MHSNQIRDAIFMFYIQMIVQCLLKSMILLLDIHLLMQNRKHYGTHVYYLVNSSNYKQIYYKNPIINGKKYTLKTDNYKGFNKTNTVH